MRLPPSFFPSPFSPCPLSPPFPHSGYFLPTSPDLAADFLRKVPKDFHRLLAPALARPWAQNRPRGLGSFFGRLFDWRGLGLLAFWGVPLGANCGLKLSILRFTSGTTGTTGASRNDVNTGPCRPGIHAQRSQDDGSCSRRNSLKSILLSIYQ